MTAAQSCVETLECDCGAHVLIYPASGGQSTGLSRADLHAIVDDVWSSLAGSGVDKLEDVTCDCCPMPPTGTPGRVEQSCSLQAAAVIAGPVPVSVTVCADAAALDELSFAMTGSTQAADRVDALAELVNQVAGGVKGLLPDEASLTVPAVQPGCGQSSCRCGLALIAGAGRICVSVALA